MTISFLKRLTGTALAAIIGAGTFGVSLAEAAQKGSNSGLPVPRFVSIKSGQANVRVGPGRDYRVDWVYTRPGLPVEVVAEFDNWRRIRDAEGTEGWIFGALLSGRRTAIAAPWLSNVEAGAAPDGTPASAATSAVLTLRRGPSGDSRPVASIEPGVVGSIEDCDGDWCRFEPLSAKGEVAGYLRQIELFGAYPGERFED